MTVRELNELPYITANIERVLRHLESNSMVPDWFIPGDVETDPLRDVMQAELTELMTEYLCYLVGTIYQENRLSQGGHYADGRCRFDPIISGGTASLDAPTDENQESPEPLYNFLSNEQLAAPFPNAADLMIEQVYQQQLHDILEELIADLTDQQQFVIRQKYYEGKDCAAIAKELRIIRSRVYALEDQGLLQLKKTGQNIGLEKFLNDEIDYYAGTGLSRFKQSGASSTERLAQRRMELEARFAKQL